MSNNTNTVSLPSWLDITDPNVHSLSLFLANGGTVPFPLDAALAVALEPACAEGDTVAMACADMALANGDLSGLEGCGIERNPGYRLAVHLGEDPADVEQTYAEGGWKIGSQEWLVFDSEEEAETAAADRIREMVWAFSPWFIASHTPEGADADTIQAIQDNERCEGNNPTLLALVEDGSGFESFADDAIGEDGLGHFLAGYDGHQEELPGGGVAFREN